MEFDKSQATATTVAAAVFGPWSRAAAADLPLALFCANRHPPTRQHDRRGRDIPAPQEIQPLQGKPDEYDVDVRGISRTPCQGTLGAGKRPVPSMALSLLVLVPAATRQGRCHYNSPPKTL